MPTYLQLVQQVEQALRLGYLRQGDQLPRVKDVVAGLAINPNTVLKAYRELEHRGLVAGRRGLGTFVEGTLDRVGLREQAALQKSMLAWMRTASEAGLDEAGMSALFTAALHELRQSRDGRPDEDGGSGRAGVVA
ncbi:GntR family transcriptional regulator [Actinoallomurus sp. NPDC050550]|uniref:GntR family transcriptional regulator n=1 Tax=Actinoallomurus sp. NPDC050550 TaxID=3154937 RepID=UPI0033E0F610